MIKSLLQGLAVLAFVAMLFYDWRMVPLAIVAGLLLWDWWRHRPSVPASNETEEIRK